jgi:hypothetical protein
LISDFEQVLVDRDERDRSVRSMSNRALAVAVHGIPDRRLDGNQAGCTGRVA